MPRPVFNRPDSAPQPLRQIIPLPSMEPVRRPAFTTNPPPPPTVPQTTPRFVPFATNFIVTTTRPFSPFNRQFTHVPRQPQPVFRPVQVAGVCMDTDPLGRCRQWAQLCRSQRYFAFMSTSCRATCRFC